MGQVGWDVGQNFVLSLTVGPAPENRRFYSGGATGTGRGLVLRGDAGDVGKGEVGSNSGASLSAPWVWWWGGDRLLVEQAEVAETGDAGDRWLPRTEPIIG